MIKNSLKENKIILNFHGGLGNQLFQIHYANCLKDFLNFNSIEFLFKNNKKSPRKISTKFTGISNSISFFERIRIAKLMEKLRLNEGIFKINELVYLDGYFQSSLIYEKFNNKIILSSLMQLRDIFSITPYSSDKTLIHLRLTDFFKNINSAKFFLIDFIKFVPSDVDIVTDDQDFLAKQEFIKYKNLNIIDTSYFEAEDLLLFMSRYKTIYSNDSTLSFWASCLSGAEYRCFSNKYEFLHLKFKNILYPQS